MEAIFALSLIMLVTSQSTAQLFPFSNLRHYLAKNQPGGKVVQPIQPDEQSTARPYRHTDSQSTQKTFDLPSVPNFGPGDIFSQEPKDEQSTERPYRNTDTQNAPKLFDLTSMSSFDDYTFPEQPREEDKLSAKRENNPTDKVIEHKQQKRRRVPTRTNTEEQKPENERSDFILVTPKPVYRFHNTKHDTQADSELRTQSRVRPTEESSRFARPVHYGSIQINTNEEPILVKLKPKDIQNSKREDNIESTSELTFPSKDPILVESIPSLHFSVDQQPYRPNRGGLVDYLTPPKLTSVYSSANNFNPDYYSGSGGVTTSRLSKLKPPPPTQAKKIKYRIKKYRLKPTHGPPHALRIRKPKAEPLLLPTQQPIRQADKITVENVEIESPHSGSSQGKTARQVALDQAGSKLDEQITAETGFTGVAAATQGHGSGQRVEFQMHGQSGPESYKFGYDTGKGHNRQFRFEEKDNHGYVKGHYGYYDKTGKLQVVNYEADPEHGFKADSV